MVTVETMSLDDLRADGATTSVVRAGRALGLSRASSYRMANSGEIPTIRIGRSLRVPTDALIRMIDSDYGQPPLFEIDAVDDAVTDVTETGTAAR